MKSRAFQLWFGIIVFVATALNFQPNFVRAAFISVANPNTPSSLSVQITLVDSELRGSISDPARSSAFTLNQVASSPFRPGGPVAFQVAFNGISGSNSLMVDFNRDGNFWSNESLFIGSAEMPAMDHFSGKTFEYLSAPAFDSSSSRKSVLNNLRISDNSFGAVTAGGTHTVMSVTVMSVTVIPEPVGASLFVLGGLAFAICGHRRFRSEAGH